MENPCTEKCTHYEHCRKYGLERGCGERKEYIKDEKKKNKMSHCQ